MYKNNTLIHSIVHSCHALFLHKDVYLFAFYCSAYKWEICLYMYRLKSEGKKNRNLKDGTLYIRFLVLSLAYLDEWKRRARTHIQIHRAKKEKCYGETLLAMITRPTNGCALARKKSEIRENVNLTTKNSWWLTCLFAKERIQPRCFLFFLAPPSTYAYTS